MSAEPGSPVLPSGQLTFVFTDIEGSTVLLRRLGDAAYRGLLEKHNALIRGVLARSGGTEVATEGDSFFAVFTSPVDAMTAVRDIQQAFDRADDELANVKVRIGAHAGTGVLGADNYVGVDVHRAQRIAAAAHGGQVLVSAATADEVGTMLPEGASLRRLGKYRLVGFDQPETLFQMDITGLATAFDPPRGAHSPSILPDPLTDFVGRDAELEALGGLVRTGRLVTLTGTGGTGKTRLAVELGRSVEGEFDDGVYFVPLAPIRQVDLIATTVASVLGLQTAATVSPEDHLRRHLAERESMLILDNFEHLIGGTSFVSGLLESAPSLKMVVTSRVPLRIPGEREFPVPPLIVPGEGEEYDERSSTPSVALFAHRAAAVRPDFELSAANIGVISTIARSLDGLPLAIELAASRMRTLTPEAILERLSNRLLSSTSSDVPERQRSIVNAIGWSYDNLDSGSRRLFEELSVFMGSFAIDEVEAVSSHEDLDDILDGLTTLVENSLLLQTGTSGTPRFRMLTVIREYAYAALSARSGDAETQDRHARTFLDLADAAEKEILTSRQGHWLDRLTADHDNLRAAFDHSVRVGDTDTALGLVGSLWRFWQIRGHLDEGRSRTESALALPPGKEPLRRARALTGLGGMMYWQGDWQGTLAPYEEALALSREHGNDVDVAEALYNHSFPLAYSGDVEYARRQLEESLELSQGQGRRIGVGRALWGLGQVETFNENWDAVLELNTRAAEELSGIDAPFDLGWAWFVIAHAHQKAGRSDQAVPFLRKALDIFEQTRDVSALTLLFEAFSLAALRHGDGGTSARLLGASNRLKADTGVSITEVEVNQFSDMIEFMEHRDAVFDAAYEEGLGYSIDEAIALARGDRTGPDLD